MTEPDQGCVARLRGDGSNLRCRAVGTVPTHQGLMCKTHAREEAARAALRAAVTVPPCPDCGHPHTSPAWGSICIGCPCLSVPAFVGGRR